MPPPERLLQQIWFHQRLQRDRLLGLDARPVQVLHPGFWNREPGPDFRNAVLRLGDDDPVRGDVEVDLRSSGWHAHGHDRNPAFRNVVLHVVWQADAPCKLATLVVREVLDAPLEELILWLGGDQSAGFPDALNGKCCEPLRHLTDDEVSQLLNQSALVRLQTKAGWLQARARCVGWEQALWEGLFRALGYKHNVWPMQRLGELRGTILSAGPINLLSLHARLLGVAGLLPEDLSRKRTARDAYLRRLWDCWWREREALAASILPRTVWRFAGLRPGNHPQRRLALAAHWLAKGDLPGRVEKWCAESIPDSQLALSLHKLLQVGKDDFWSRHWNLKSAAMPAPQPLLGAARATDLAVNIILPWLWVRAWEGKNERLRRAIEQRYLAWPKSQDNAVLRLARNRLLGARRGQLLRSAADQQGLMQIVRDFCERSDSLCTHCRFPELVRDWQEQGRIDRREAQRRSLPGGASYASP